MENMLTVENVSRTFSSGQKDLTVLDDINFSVSKGETLSIVGPSGSGKTTLLSLCAGLDVPTQGTISIDGVKLNSLNEDERAFLRNQKVGFIFQNFQLLPTLTALENVAVPMELRGERNAYPAAKDLLERVGLGDRTDHFPSQLSGGEQQRVSIARAFITKPGILFADEPTGNLDEETADKVSQLVFDLNTQEGTTLVLVTHNMELAQNTSRIVKLKRGKLVTDTLAKAL